MPRIHGASRPVTIGCFCHSLGFFHPPAQSFLISTEIEMNSAPLASDDIRTPCALMSTRALYSCRSDVSDYQIHLVVPFHCLAEGRTPLILVRVFIT